MIKHLKGEIEAKERSRPLEHKSISGNRAYENYSTTSSLAVSSQEEKCKFCGYGNHVLSRCQKVSDPIVRKTILKKKGNCFVCLKPGHIRETAPQTTNVLNAVENIISICSKDQNYNHVWTSEEKNKQQRTQNIPSSFEPEIERFTTNSSSERTES